MHGFRHVDLGRLVVEFGQRPQLNGFARLDGDPRRRDPQARKLGDLYLKRDTGTAARVGVACPNLGFATGDGGDESARIGRGDAPVAYP